MLRACKQITRLTHAFDGIPAGYIELNTERALADRFGRCPCLIQVEIGNCNFGAVLCIALTNRASDPSGAAGTAPWTLYVRLC